MTGEPETSGWLNVGADAPPPSAPIASHAVGTELFAASGPSADDVAQNSIGDCWLDATMAALAQTNPQLIASMIHAASSGSQNGAQVYDVTLNYNGTVEQYEVAASFPVGYHGANLGAATPLDSSNSKAIVWSAVLENALGQYLQKHPDVSPLSPSGSSVYQSLNYVGNPNWVYKATTGQAPDIAGATSIDGLLSSNTFAHSDQLGGPAAVAGTGILLSPGQSLPLPSGAKLTAQPNNVMLYTPPSGPAIKILNHHEYTVVSQSSGTVTLRNPWGHGVDGGSPNVTVAQDDVSSIFAQLAFTAPSTAAA